MLKMSVSLDGFVAGPNGEADWIFRTSGGDDSTAWVLQTLREAGVHIMGRRSYDVMAAFWPYSDMPIAPPMNDIPKVIFSRKGLKDGTPVDLTTPSLVEAKRAMRTSMASRRQQRCCSPGPNLRWQAAISWRKFSD
ncbi:dihydrofolate reductase [Rhodanobacter sp. MP1X3]|nr:dihydrofolate reductase [Rhodanobacter sp. MP1X3]